MQRHRLTRTPGDRQRGIKDTGRQRYREIDGVKKQKCASKDSRQDTEPQKRNAAEQRQEEIREKKRYQESETWKRRIRVETRTSGL